jgi:hypothetical protein
MFSADVSLYKLSEKVFLTDLLAFQNNSAMIVDPEKSDAAATFRMVQSLRNTIDVVLVARACCGANLEVVRRLQNCSQASLRGNSDIESRETSLVDYISSADALQSRLRNAIELVGTGIDTI